MSSPWLQWLSSPPSAGCPWLASPGPHVLLWRRFREQGQGWAAGFTPGASPACPPIQLRGTSASFPYFTSCKLLNTHTFSSQGVSSNEPCFVYLLRCCLTVFHGLPHSSWEHGMSNISILYCYATFYCFGLEMAWWGDTYMYILARFLHSSIFDWNCHVFRCFVFCSVLAKGTLPEVKDNSTCSYKSLI